MDLTQSAQVVVFSRAGCHLCEVAEEIVDAVCRELEVEWTRVDIDSDPALRRRFNDEVPVTFVGGEQHDMWRVDPQRLRKRLASPR